MQQAHKGIKGIVTSRATGKPIPNAIISISGRENSLNTTDNGEYWKILLPGVYKMIVSIMEKKYIPNLQNTYIILFT